MVRVSTILKASAVVGALGVLSSCATLNEDECQSVNWNQLGEGDGTAGRPMSYIDQHRRACERYKIPVDDSSWRSGWEYGIRFYCTPQNGLVQGREGRGYANSCPADLKAGFESAYYVAKRLYDARQARDRLDNEISSLEARVRSTEDREARRNLRRELEDKRSSMWSADRRVSEAQREYEVYIFTNNLASR